MEYTIGMIINEMKIIDINNDKYTVECIVCHRQKIVSKNSLKKGKILFHKHCVQKEKPTNFYNIWLNYKKKQNCLFVDFYDKFYSFYLDLKQLEKLKIIHPIDEIRIERINNDYFLIPYNYKYSHRIYDAVIYEKDDYLDKFRKTWSSILGRITNKDNRDYKNYGGRGIKLEFESFYQFYKDLYSDYLEAIKKYPNEVISIDRIDVNKNYSKENIRWIPMSWQNGNRRQNKWIKIISAENKVYLTKNLFNFSTYMDINYNTAHDNLIYQTNNTQGWKFEYIDIKKYKNLPINEIDVILEITNYPNYKILYKKEV